MTSSSLVRKHLTRVRIPSRFIQAGLPREALAEFKLGKGPCGKTVDLLATKATPEGFVLAQRCTDKTYQRFIYPWNTITGRIEEEYETSPGPSL